MAALSIFKYYQIEICLTLQQEMRPERQNSQNQKTHLHIQTAPTGQVGVAYGPFDPYSKQSLFPGQIGLDCFKENAVWIE